MKTNSLIHPDCDEQLVSEFIDNRMTPIEKKEYLKKINQCITIKNCSHCNQLIIDFLSIKKNCNRLFSDYTMSANLENNLLKRIRESFHNSKTKQ